MSSNAFCTQLWPSLSVDLLPFSDAITTGRAALPRITAGAATAVSARPSPARVLASTNSRRFSVSLIDVGLHRLGCQHEPEPADRRDLRRAGYTPQLRAHAGHVRIDDVGLRVELHFPNFVD